MEGTEGTEGVSEGTEGGNLPRFVSSKSGSYDYAKELIKNAVGWVQDNKEYLKTQIPYYSDVKRVEDDAQYWKDYKKNTGFTARYPYRTYGHSGTYVVSSASRLFRNVKRLYG